MNVQSERQCKEYWFILNFILKYRECYRYIGVEVNKTNVIDPVNLCKVKRDSSVQHDTLCDVVYEKSSQFFIKTRIILLS